MVQYIGPHLCGTLGARVQFVFSLFDFRWTWVPFTESPVSDFFLSLWPYPCTLGLVAAWGHSFAFLGVLEFWGGVWFWRWGLQGWREGRLSPFGWNRPSESSNPQEGLSWPSWEYSICRAEARVAGGWGHSDWGRSCIASLGFVHTLVSALLWLLPERRVNGLGWVVGWLLRGFYEHFWLKATWALEVSLFKNLRPAPKSQWASPSSHPNAVFPKLLRAVAGLGPANFVVTSGCCLS